MNEQKKLLVVFAHPDDEAFGAGGVIAKYAREGVEVSYICATRGNRGTIAPEFLETFGSVDAVRDAELDCAAQVLGFKEVFKLGYGDSGMMGSSENDDPECLWQADETEVTGKIVQIIRQIQPQVIVTFDPFGGYGHPDHIFVHRATLRAFEAAGDASQFPEAGSAYQPQKLYYSNMPRFLLRVGVWKARLQGQNPRKLGANQDFDMVEILEHFLPNHALINVRDYMEVWDKANECHASQGGGRAFRLPDWLRNYFLNKQGFTRYAPAPKKSERMERDLFEGVR